MIASPRRQPLQLALGLRGNLTADFDFSQPPRPLVIPPGEPGNRPYPVLKPPHLPRRLREHYRYAHLRRRL